jgi:hypothetical protein
MEFVVDCIMSVDRRSEHKEPIKTRNKYAHREISANPKTAQSKQLKNYTHRTQKL